MVVRHETTPDHGTRGSTSRGGWQRVSRQIATVIGAIAVFLGLFILFAGDDQSVGIGGDWSWETGELSDWWGYGFLIGGVILLAGALFWVLSERRNRNV
jgi:multisubunit Na+/H+ antiporter MnhB subunit